MLCPDCGAQAKGVALVIGIVKLTTRNCKCGRHWREREMMVDFMHSVVKEELERLHRKHYGEKSTQTKCVLHYLQSKLDDHSASKMERDAATRKRRMDHWERQFLQEALSEVY